MKTYKRNLFYVICILFWFVSFFRFTHINKVNPKIQENLGQTRWAVIATHMDLVLHSSSRTFLWEKTHFYCVGDLMWWMQKCGKLCVSVAPSPPQSGGGQGGFSTYHWWTAVCMCLCARNLSLGSEQVTYGELSVRLYYLQCFGWN